MKRYFVCWAAAAVLLLSGFANAKPNLQLILEGPFVVCEDTASKKLNIVIPDLQGMHYVPGLASAFLQVSLGQQADPSSYQNWPDVTDYKMGVWNSAKSGAMKLMPDRSATPVAYFYGEKGNCNTLDLGFKSIALTVPFPDELWALNPTDKALAIKDHKTGATVGECKKKFCQYATKIVLRYLGVDDLCVTGFPSGSFCADAAGSIGNEIQIELTAEPLPVADETASEAHVKASFWRASKLAGVYREINFAPTVNVAVPVLHRVCQGAPIFLCDPAQHAACAP